MSISKLSPRSGLMAAVSTLVLCAVGAPAAAETEAAATPAEAAQDGRRANIDPSYADVGDVVVTARRREERAQDVPIALTVIGGEQLDDSNTYNVGQLTQTAPSVQLLSSNPRNTAITIRGIGASYGLANDGLEQGVGIYVDQVYYGRPATATLDFVDLDQIEILRGPQGTLFGKNTTAGALNITTRNASFTPGAAAEISVGDLGFVQAKASVTGPLIGDTLAGRLSLVSTRRDGTLDNVRIGRDQNDQHSFAVRGQLLWQPSEQLTVRAYGDWNRQLLECCTQVYVGVGVTGRSALQQYANLVSGRPDAAPPSTNPYDRLVDVDGDIQADQWQAGGSVIVDYDFGNLLFTSITAYREWDWEPANDRDYTGLDILRKNNNPSHQDQTSQEFRLSSVGDNRIDWVTGLYYFNQTVATNGITEYGADASYWLLGCAPIDPDAPVLQCSSASALPSALLDGYTAINVSSIETSSYAVFGQLTWNVTDRLRVTPGLRFTYEEKDGEYDLSVFGGSDTTNATEISRRLGLQRPQNYTADVSEDSLSGQIAVSYELRPDVLAYVSYATGEKSGGINMTGLPLLQDNTPALDRAVVKPEQVTTYELGLKTQAFDRRLTANLAAYYTEIEDFQANVVDIAGPGAIRGYISNVEKVEIQGVELDLNAHPNSAIDIYANVTWTDGEYTSFANGPCPLERVGTATQCDLSGQELPGVSPWAFALGGELHGQGSLLGLSGEVFVGADASYRSTYNSDAAVSRYTEIDGYGLLNLRAGFRAGNGWEASVWVKNALDEEYLQFVSVQTGNSGLVIGNPGDERTVGVTLRARY